jgi:hypothetical protein
MSNNKNHEEITRLLEEAAANLQKAKYLAEEDNKSYYWEGPTYGMGGWISSGEWEASSHSC